MAQASATGATGADRAVATTADPWELARNRYLQTLDPEGRVLFTEATIQNLYYSASNTVRDDRLNSKTRRAVSAVQPLVDKIEEYGKAMDTYANMAPTFLAPLWGSLRVVLVLAKSLGKFFDRMTDTLGRIGDILPRLLDYQRVFSHAKHPRLSEALAVAYLDIIELCMEFRFMIKEQQKHPLKRVVQPLSSSVDQKLKDAETRFRAHRKTVEKEAEVCNMIEAAEVRAVVLRDEKLRQLQDQVETKKRILGLLSPTNSTQKHERVRSRWCSETGNWLLATAEYTSWMDLEESAVLCCYGIPGSGKTVLASHAIEALTKIAKASHSAVTFHYCDHADKRTLDPCTIFGTLARHLLAGIELQPQILELVSQHYRDGDHIPGQKAVLEILSKTIELFENVFLVLDGLDEVSENDRPIVYEGLQKLMSTHRVPLKLLVMCRDNAAAAFLPIPGRTFAVHVSESAIERDIQGFVRSSVASLLAQGELVICAPELQEDIVSILIEGAKGMFLWVVFQLAELCTAESDDGIQTILRHLPKDLGETYDRLLGRIIGSERQRLVKRMFQWIICARRPLTTEEICEGIAFTIDDDFWNVAKIPTDISRLVRACGNLIVIDEETRTLQMAHYTVEQYILHTSTSADKFFHFDLQEAEEILGEVCVAYLNFSDFETQLVRYVDNGINAGMATIEKVVTSSQKSGPLAAMSVIRRLRGNRIEATNIDYSRYITMKTKPPEKLLDDYRLLSYVRENWLWHTARFRPNGQVTKRRDVLFGNLIFEKQLPFSFRPWKTTSIAKLKHRYLEPLGWALVMDHCALILALMKIDPAFRPWSYITDIGEWFFEGPADGFASMAFSSGESHYFLCSLNGYNISKAMMDRLGASTNDPWDPNLISAEAWLYSKMLSACRHGNLGVFRLCVSEFITTYFANIGSLIRSSSRTAIKARSELSILALIAHLVIEAAKSHQNEILNFFLGSSIIKTKEWKFLTMTAFNGIAYNALEYAAISGNVVAVKILFEEGCLRPKLGPEAVLDFLDSAVTEGQAEVVESLLTLLYLLPAYFSPWASTSSFDEFKSCEERSLASFLNAVSLGNLTVTATFESMGFDLLEPDSGGICPYTRAIREGNYNTVNYVLHEGFRKGDGRGVKAIFDGFPLTVAAAVGKLNIAKLLVRNGANVFSESHIDNDEIISKSGLYSRFKKIPRPQYTIMLNSNHLSTMVLSYEEMSVSPTPLYAAAANGREEMVEWLLSQGALPDFVSPTGLISWPATLGKPSIGLLASHIKLRNAPLPEQFTRSQFLFSGYPDSCFSFDYIESMFDLAYYQRPLAGAVLNGHIEVVRILLQAKVDINLEDSNGLSAVYLAVALGYSEIVQLLLDAGALFDKDDPWAANQFLDCASDEQRTEALELFLQLGVSPNTTGPENISALCRAISNEALGCFSILLRAGADIDLRNSEDRTGFEIMRLYLQNGSEVDSIHVDGWKFLFAACEESQTRLVAVLLSNGADPNYKFGSHLPYFQYMMEENDKKFHKREVKEYHLKFPIGTTPIMVASAGGDDNIISQLVKAGADIEAKNEFGATALLCACAWGHEAEVRSLLNAGASLFAKDAKGRSALNHACRGEHVNIVDFLLGRHYGVGPFFSDRDVQRASGLQSRRNYIGEGWKTEPKDYDFYYRPFVDEPILSTAKTALEVPEAPTHQ